MGRIFKAILKFIVITIVVGLIALLLRGIYNFAKKIRGS